MTLRYIGLVMDVYDGRKPPVCVFLYKNAGILCISAKL